MNAKAKPILKVFQNIMRVKNIFIFIWLFVNLYLLLSIDNLKRNKMVEIRKAKQKKLTTQMTFEAETVNQLRSNIALGLLTGSFNPLRKYSKDGQSIDLDKLKVLQENFNYLICEVENEMTVKLLNVENF
jgi:hypothetical protein